MILVCPNCGKDEFELVTTTRTGTTVRVNDWGFEELESTIEDAGVDEELKCTNCFSHFPEDTDELVAG